MPNYPTTRAFTATYTERTYASPYDRLQTYERVMQAAADHPNKKSSALSSIVELPRYQIKTWVDDGGKPDVVRGVETARENGWLDVEVTSKRFDALNTLVAAVFSGGTINERYEPAFTPDADGITFNRVTDALAQLGAGIKTRGDSDTERPTEALPQNDTSVLGRVLVALGAPSGAKNSETDVSLPPYLDDGPEYLRRDFVEVYLWNRGHEAGDGKTVQINEQRPEQFREELGDLIEDVTDASVYLHRGGVSISADAIDKLRY